MFLIFSVKIGENLHILKIKKIFNFSVLIDDLAEENKERLFECETVRVSRRRRPYNTVSYIRQRDGRCYEIDVNGEVLPCTEELDQSEFFTSEKCDTFYYKYLEKFVKISLFFSKYFFIFHQVWYQHLIFLHLVEKI